MRLYAIVFFLFILSYGHAQTWSPSSLDCSHKHAHGIRANDKTGPDLIASNHLSVDSAMLTYAIDPGTQSTSGSLQFTYISPDSVPVELAESMTLDSMLIGGAISFPDKIDGYFWLPIQTEYTKAQLFFSGSPSDPRSARWDTVDQRTVFYTLSQPYGGRQWWPQIAASDFFYYHGLTIQVLTPDSLQGSSNGYLVESVVANGERTNTWRFDYSIYNYLVAVAMGPYDLYQDTIHTTTIDGDILEVPYFNLFYTHQADSLYALSHRADPIFDLFHQYFPDYPFGSYGHTQWTRGGGMEHSGNSFMGNMNDDLIAHELAHQWFGDLVAINAYNDIWLNEGFATFCTGLIFEEIFVEWADDWRRYYIDLVASEPDGSVYVYDASDPSRIFDRRLSYGKGGMVLVTLRQQVGEDDFYSGLRLYLERYRRDIDTLYHRPETTTDLFFETMEEACNCSLQSFKEQWVLGEGYPSYDLSWSSNNGLLDYSLAQETSHPSVDFFENKVLVRVFGEGRTEDFFIEPNSKVYNSSISLSIADVDSLVVDPDMAIVNGYARAKRVSLDDIQLFPNPANYSIQIYWSPMHANRADLRLINATGAVVKEQSVENHHASIDVNSLPAGHYTLQLRFEDGVIIQSPVIVAH